MEGGFQKRTPQPGQIMFPPNKMEVRDATHEAGSTEGDPPTAKGDRPPAQEPARELIAPKTRPSFLQLLSALWGAEEELKQRRGAKTRKPERPQPNDPDQEEKP